MQDKITFESVLKECGFSQNNILSRYCIDFKGIEYSAIYAGNRCDVFKDGRSILVDYIKSPLRLKVLLDILLETHDRPTSE